MSILFGTVVLLSGCGVGGRAPSDVAPPHAQTLADAPVVTHADGVGYVVWIQPADKSGQSGLFSSRQRNGVWDLPQQIHASTDAGSQASEPRWVVHPGGEATLVWLQTSLGGVREVFHSRTVDGVWRAGGPIRPTSGEVVARGVQIAGDGAGNAMAVWTESVGDAEAKSVWGSRFDGDGFGVPEKLNVSDEAVYAPRVTMTDSGSALVIWDRDAGHRREPSASVYWNGSWTPSQLVDTDTSNYPLWAQVLPRIF